MIVLQLCTEEMPFFVSSLFEQVLENVNTEAKQ